MGFDQTIFGVEHGLFSNRNNYTFTYSNSHVQNISVKLNKTGALK